MNNFSLRISTLGLFLIFTNHVVNAQSKNVENIGTYITNEMSFLNMTTLQTEQVYQINLHAANTLENLNNESKAQHFTHAEEIDGLIKILKQRNIALQELLSPSQFQLFKENKIVRAATFRTMVMNKMLDLTQDQLDSVFDINQKAAENVRKELDAYLSADSKRSKRKAQHRLQQSFKQTDKAFDKILSPQQTTIYHENVDLLRNIIREEYNTNDSF